MSNTTITNIAYTSTVETATVASTYGIPVTAHIWGAGGGSSSLYPGAGGGYSRVNFVAKPGDVLTVAVGQGGGAGGVTAPPPVPPVTWTTRDTNYVGTVLYPFYPYATRSALLITDGVWNNIYGLYGNIDTTWTSVSFPVSGYYTITGSSAGCGFTIEPQGGGTLYIDSTAIISLPGNFGGGTQTAKYYVNAGTHSVRVYVEKASNGRGQQSSIAFTISQANPPRITSTPAGLPGASYIALLFNTRFPPPNQAALVYAVGNGDSFLDQWGVWESDQNTNSFTRTYTINFPATANVIFQMSCNNTGTLLLDGDAILSRTAIDNPNTPSQVTINVPAGNHNVVISATGTVGGVNRVGVTFGTGDQTSYSGGRGGISDPTSKQGFGGGGGGATILSLNGRVIGVAAGGGGGAGAAPTNITYITTKYTGSLSTQPFVNTACGSVITPGTSGYYVYGTIHYDGANEGSIGQFSAYQWCIIVNGTVVYGPSTQPPPVNTAQTTQFMGWSCYDPSGLYNDFPAVQCYSFDYTAVNTGAITNIKSNGQNGQDEYNFNTTDTGGGGGGGGGARGGNGGGARGSGGGGFSGHNGLSLGGSAVFPSTGRLPFTNSYYPGGGVAEGGTSGTAANGGNGYIVLEYQTGGGMAVKDGGEWKSVQTAYVKDEGTWKEVQATYINQGGIWTPVKGAVAPAFTSVNGAFGALVRPSTAGTLTYVAPPAPDYSNTGFTGYGSTDMF